MSRDVVFAPHKWAGAASSREAPLGAGQSKENKLKSESIKDFLESQESEIINAMLVSTLVFTVSAAAILQPDDANILGDHTDLYGSLCCLSLITNLGSVLFGTLMKRQLQYTMLHQAKHVDEAIEFIELPQTRFWLALPNMLMWAGSCFMTAALAINVNEVFKDSDGHAYSTSFITMMASGSLMAIVVLIGALQMDCLRKSHKMFGRFDARFDFDTLLEHDEASEEE